MVYYYLLLFPLFLVLMLGYFRIAKKFNIVDTPNQRSSHTRHTIRGGGIIFPLSVVAYCVLFNNVDHILLLGMILIALVSFIDDIFTLPNYYKFLIHLIAVSLLLNALDAFIKLPLWLVPVTYILVIGFINAYNFMDGINGITGLYSLIALGTLFYLNNIKQFVDPNFIGIAMLACITFLFFNFRKQAKCFAGDVGSISIGFLIISLSIMLIFITHELKYILFYSVYGVDTVLTIIHRLWLRLNIFSAHRLHLYQLLANERKISPLYVSTLYALLQLLINAIIICSSLNFLDLFLVINLPLCLLYIFTKRNLMKSYQSTKLA